MAIIHVVLFDFKPSTDPATIQEVCKGMVELRNQCVHPTTQKPYITGTTGGKQDSPEGNKAPFTHAFVIEFANEEDRKYYAEEDQVHLDFKKTAAAHLEKAGVIDYTPGVY